MKCRLAKGARSTSDRPKERTARTSPLSLEKSRFRMSVVTPICTVSKRRQRW